MLIAGNKAVVSCVLWCCCRVMCCVVSRVVTWCCVFVSASSFCCRFQLWLPQQRGLLRWKCHQAPQICWLPPFSGFDAWSCPSVSLAVQDKPVETLQCCTICVCSLSLSLSLSSPSFKSNRTVYWQTQFDQGSKSNTSYIRFLSHEYLVLIYSFYSSITKRNHSLQITSIAPTLVTRIVRREGW